MRVCDCNPAAAGAFIFACNDDSCGSQSELSSLTLDAGTTYYIFVDGFDGAVGAYTLSITSP